MGAYIIIQTKSERYKCHGYSRKAGRIYFNSRAVNMTNVVSITDKNDVVIYNNPDVKVKEVVKTSSHHYSTLKGAEPCKATRVVKPKSGVIEI